MARINEQRQTPPGKIQRMLNLQLKITDQLEAIGQAFGIEPVLQALKQQRPERVITAARVAAGKNNNRRFQQFRKHC
jgi:hypothetical protein